jgi:hypothetical protein
MKPIGAFSYCRSAVTENRFYNGIDTVAWTCGVAVGSVCEIEDLNNASFAT